MNYIVTGGGRTGSHLVHEIMQFLRPNWQSCFDFNAVLPNSGSLIHTNQVHSLADRDSELCCNETLIICRRRDQFATAISLLVARYTNEWFSYSNKKVDSIIIDQRDFLKTLAGTDHWYHTIDSVKMKFLNSINIWFEDLIESEFMEHYVADQLGWDRVHPKTDGWTKSRNPRDYQTLVINWQELHDIYLDHQSTKPV